MLLGWRDLFLAERPGRQELRDPLGRIAFIRSPRATQALGSAGRGQLLVDMEFISGQLRLLREQYVNAASGLSSLQVCRLLLRAGGEHEDGPIAARLQRLAEEMELNEIDHTVDDGCTLCTATALSCLTLSGGGSEVSHLALWLLSHRKDRFCYLRADYATGARANEHAMHYAAQVLEGLSDAAVEGDESRAEVVEALFTDRTFGKDAYPREWMRFRNIESWEVCQYIFTGLLKAHLARPLKASSEALQFVSTALTNLAKRLDEEQSATYSNVTNLYSARESLGSFVLGKILGNQSATLWLDRILSMNQRRASGARAQNFKQLMDSSVDRTTWILDGWLCWWEVQLAGTAFVPWKAEED